MDSGLGKQTVQALQKFLAMQPDVLELKPARKKKLEPPKKPRIPRVFV